MTPRTARKPAVGYRRSKNDNIIAKVTQRVVVPTTGRTILALDPGGATGCAFRHADGSVITSTVRDPADLWDLVAGRPDVLVFEMFTTAGRVDKYMIYTIELVGGLKAVAYALQIRSFIHTPGKRYPYLEAARLIVGSKYDDRHEVDALAHLLAWEYDHSTPQP